MKLTCSNQLFLAAGVVLGTLLHPAYAGEHEVSENNLRALQGGPPAHVLQLFKERGHIKRNVKLQSQTVSGSAVEIDGEQISLADADLTPFQAPYTSGATFMVNGVSQGAIPSCLFRSKNSPSVTVAKNANGKLLRATKMNSGIVTTEVLPAEEGSDIFLEVPSDAIDADEVNSKFRYADAPIGGRRSLQQSISDRVSQESSPRALQGSCSTFKVIEMAIVFDNTFCADFGNDMTTANDKVTQLIDATSNFYQQDGLCTKVVISHVEGYCDADNDPYEAIMSKATMICDNTVDDLLYDFRTFWNNERSSIPRDTAHWFFGYDPDPTGTVGCAFVDAMCGSYAYGVNWVTFSSSLFQQEIVVTHKLGHNAGSNHDPASGCTSFVMCPFVISDQNAVFSDSSVNQITSHFNSVSCIGEEVTVCGDGTCDEGETTASCPGDCGTSCGDGACNGGETNANCAADCPAICGDGFCAASESTAGCPSDCGTSCGDGTCNGGETNANCAADCPAICGDGFCAASESTVGCPSDCGSNCGDGTCNGGESSYNCPEDCGACLEGSHPASHPCTANTNCCSGACTGGRPRNRVCAGSGGCGGNRALCNTNSDCCSNNCRNSGRCKGGRRLGQQDDHETSEGFPFY